MDNIEYNVSTYLLQPEKNNQLVTQIGKPRCKVRPNFGAQLILPKTEVTHCWYYIASVGCNLGRNCNYGFYLSGTGHIVTIKRNTLYKI